MTMAASFGVIAFGAGPANAATCSVSWANKDPLATTTNQPSTVYAGPYTSCNPVFYTGTGANLNLDCYTVNANGVSWTHVGAGGSHGWIPDSHLSDGGSIHPCL
jgi:hypothetical protein